MEILGLKDYEIKTIWSFYRCFSPVMGPICQLSTGKVATPPSDPWTNALSTDPAVVVGRIELEVRETDRADQEV